MGLPFASSNTELVAAAVVTLITGVAFYRLILHPLAKFPGPRLAAISGIYEFYYHVILHGKFHEQLARLHAKYGEQLSLVRSNDSEWLIIYIGSIVRIGPNELHVNHPDAYDQIYCVGSKLSKWKWYYAPFGIGLATSVSTDNNDHSQRRAAISTFFSRKSVLGFGDVMAKPVERLRSRLDELFAKGGSCNLNYAYRCISLETTSEITFGRSFNFLDTLDFGSFFHAGVENAIRTICTIRYFPFLIPVFNNMPTWAMALAGERLAAVMMLRRFGEDAARAALDDAELSNGVSSRTVLHEMVKNRDNAKFGVLSKARLEEEAISLIGASADTVGNALTMATYQLLKHPLAHQRLVDELREAIPNSSGMGEYQKLEKLPWLTAVIKESLRLSYGLIGRLPRLVPPSGVEVLGHHIPGGVIVSMSSYLQHNNADIFPEPLSFKPERWLPDDGNGTRSSSNLEKYLVSFSKGTHSCLGLSMAYILLYTTLATVHRRFDLRLEGGVTDKDLKYEDHFLGVHPRAAKKVMVSVQVIYD